MFLFLCFAGLAGADAIAQQLNDNCNRSTEGTDFWFAFMESRNYHSAHYVEITVTAREAADFTIKIGVNETFYGPTYQVAANSSVQVRIDWNLVEATGSELVQNKGIHLESTKPVNVYALNWDQNSADVAVVFPVESIGDEYFAVCYEPHIHKNNGNYGNGRNSEFLVVATENNTKVEITPSKVTEGRKPAKVPFSVVLNRGEVYQVQSMNDVNLAGQGDLTGSYVKSDKPVAFFSGSLSTTIPASSNSAWDHLYEQIPPTRSWGRNYYTIPLKSREQDRYRVIAAEDKTKVTIDDVKDTILNRGDFFEFVLYHDEFRQIYADKRILVMQYSQSQSVDANYTQNNGDPFMVVLSPVNQMVNDVTFIAYHSTQIKERYFVNVFCNTAEVPNIRLDGKDVSHYFSTFKHNYFSYAQIPLTQGPHRLQNLNPDEGFLAYVYGFGGVESYGYGVGFDLDIVLDLGETLDFQGDTLLLCYGDTIMLDASSYFDQFEWNTGETTQKIIVNEDGKYGVTASTKEGCVLTDSINVYVSRPQTNLGKDTTLCFPNSITLDAGKGFRQYLWQDGDTVQQVLADTTQVYHVTVTDKYGCSDSDTLSLVVFPVPTVKISGDTLVCWPVSLPASRSLNVKIEHLPEELWKQENSFRWTCTNSEKLTFSEQTHTRTQLNVTEWGDYHIRYELTTINGCMVSDEFDISFYQVPTSLFIVDDTSDKCEGYTRHVSYAGNASPAGNYYWDFGGCKVIDTLAVNDFSVSVGAYNYNPFVTLFVEEHGCWSDTVRLPVGAKPVFEMNATKLRGCDSLTVNFYSRLIIDDAVDFFWEFGDGASSHEASPIHFYADTAFYDVSLTITNTITGCQSGFQAADMVKVFPTPVANFSADPSVCYGDTLKVEYTHAIDSSFCYWTFERCHELGRGGIEVRKEIVIDEPTALITLKVDEYGCFSPPQSKIVKRKPHFNFAADTVQGCQPFQLEISPVANDKFLTFTWLKDGMEFPSGEVDFFMYPDSGRFTLGAAARSDETGCSDTLVKTDWLWVHPVPVSTFQPDYPVATDEHSTITFTNLSERAVTYFWDFDDGQGSTEVNPRHTYQKIGEYDVLLVAETEYSCKDTSLFQVKIIPFNVFTPNAFRPESDIPENRTFMPVGLGADIRRFKFFVYDRWGQLIFESYNPEEKWDGTMKNGNLAPMGTYVWRANFFDIQGYEHDPKGHVLLIR
ncbi:MAG: PKD domain-containing protein [Prolixibacteraceae bacterium]|nr:PKD domain-containing protein [Prolixibacteraceae bacterium]